jgi:hypothetical protein
MQIDKTNYEIWLIDWLDGNLSELQIEHLQKFLNENPELRNEFDELNTIKLKPLKETFRGKDLLKKTSQELEESQFGYLCVAYLENDLSESKKADLIEVFEKDLEKKKTFDLIQKMKILPEKVDYLHKNLLIKRSTTQRVIRLSVITLSAAATIGLILLTYLLVPKHLSDKSKDGIPSFSSQNTINETASNVKGTASKNEILISKIQTGSSHHSGKLIAVSSKQTEKVQSDSYLPEPDHASIEKKAEETVQIKKISITTNFNLEENLPDNTLVLSNIPQNNEVYIEKRSNVGRFIARNFREIFLKEKTPRDSPLKVYEIAEVGVTGLNKLLGWQMALENVNDENGNLKSVYFSSKILKFNAPIKKTQPSR